MLITGIRGTFSEAEEVKPELVNECPKSENSKDVNITGNNFSGLNFFFQINETIKAEEIKTAPNLTGFSTVFEFLQPNLKRDSLGMVTMYYQNNTSIFYITDGSRLTKTSKVY